MIHPIQKSPLRDRESNYPSYVDKMNLANVGVGMGVGVGNTPNRGGKTSLSPLRSRRTESSLSVRSGFGKKKQ